MGTENESSNLSGNSMIIEINDKKFEIVRAIPVNLENKEWLEKHKIQLITDNSKSLFLIGKEIEEAKIVSESLNQE